MTDPIPYADYVRIEVRVDGKTRVIEFAPSEWDKQDRPQIRVKPLDQETDLIVFGDHPRRSLPPGEVAISFEVSGPQAAITVDEEHPPFPSAFKVCEHTEPPAVVARLDRERPVR